MREFSARAKLPPPRPVHPSEVAVSAIADKYDTPAPQAVGSVPGHNRPPEPEVLPPAGPPPSAVPKLATALTVYADIAGWLDENPVVQDAETAKAAAQWHDGAVGALADMEAERDSIVRPLNEKVKATNEHYRGPREKLMGLRDELRARVKVFKDAEEARLQAEADEKRRIAEEAQAAAEEAVRREQEARENAAAGEVDAGVGAAVADADDAIERAKVLTRDAKRAERNDTIAVRGFGKAMSFRDEPEVLTVADAVKAVRAITKLAGKCSDKLADAIRTEARAYRKVKGALPDGVTSSKGAQ